MSHIRSNTNLLKKVYSSKNKKTNIFKKSTVNINLNYIKSNNQSGKKNYLISLLDKNTPTNFNSKKYNFNVRKNNEKEIYLTSAINSNNTEDRNKNKPKNGNINIRLNLNSEIINNNFNDYNNSTKNKNMHRSKSNMTENKKIKEKDKIITKLQKELLQSQEFLNRLQNDKQNEIIFTYNTIKKMDNMDKNFNRSLTSFLTTPSLLKFNYNYKNKNKGNINKNYNSFNTGFYSNNKRKYKIKSSSPKSNYVRCLSSSSHRFFSYNLENIDMYNSNFPTMNTFNKKSNTNIKINYNSNPSLLVNKNDEIFSPNDLYFSRQISYSNFKNENKKDINDFFYKCEKLKNRTRNLLDNYISLIKEINCKNNKNK